MALETWFFLYDQLRESNAAASIHSASSTANGFDKNAVRRPDWKTAWKPSDGSSDEYIQCDGGSAGWLGTTGGTTIYMAIAYDARGCDQSTITVQQDTTDNPAGTFSSQRALWTLNRTAPAVDFVSFPLSTNGKRYYRLLQGSSSRGGGTKTARLFGWSIYAPSHVQRIGTDDANVTGPSRIRGISNSGIFRAISRAISTNRNGGSVQEFEVNLQGCTRATWQQLLAFFDDLGGASRPFYIQHEGLYSPAREGFQLVRLRGERWSAPRSVRDAYDVSIPLVTEAAF